MKIINGYPPNINDIRKKFKLTNEVVFTYGDTLYSPRFQGISDDLMIHEQTHRKQQLNPQSWWKEYLDNPEFRLTQEIEAYHNQYTFVKKAIGIDRATPLLNKLASDLSSSLYGDCITYEEAREKIKG